MAKFDKDELKKLSPKERLEKLKQLEKEREKEASEIGLLIKQSMNEIRTEEVVSDISPEPRDVDIGKLFRTEETQLESALRESATGKEEDTVKYMGVRQAYNDYKQLQDISYSSLMGTIDITQMDRIDKIGERLEKAKYHSASAEVADILVASRATLHKIKKYAGID